MSTSPNITVENDCGSVKVMFGGVVHIHFRFDDYRGLQSWRHSDKHYCIEISLAGASIKAGYDSREKWEAIIAGIVAAVAQ
jgi:hypothetical protein